MIEYREEDSMVVLREFPDEITLAVNLYDCPHRCAGCHSKELWEHGEELTEERIDELIDSNPGITCVGFMGGDRDVARLLELNAHVKSRGLKTGWYSGWSYEDLEFRNFSYRIFEFDYVKIGRYVEELGPLESESTNQVMFKNVGGVMYNITKTFWK